MLKKTITYTDYMGEKRTEDFYFNISRAEMIAIETSVEGGFLNHLEKVYKERDIVEMSKIVQNLIYKAYGERSADGKRFVKNKELSDAFIQTEAYSELLVEFMNSEDGMIDFILGSLSGIDKSQLADAKNNAQKRLKEELLRRDGDSSSNENA